MKTVAILKSRVRDHLAEKLAHNILNANIEDLILVLRYNALGGFEFLSDDDLFENFAAALPELAFMELAGIDDEEKLVLAVKKEHRDEEDGILNDVRRVLQVI